MHSLRQTTTTGRAEVINDGTSSSIASRYYNDYKTERFENGLINILQQEQEVRALQKALNLPQTTVYSTSLTQTNRPPLLNSSVLAASTCQTKVVTETDVNTNRESLFMYGVSDPCYNTLRHNDHPRNTPYGNLVWEAVPSSHPFPSNLIHDRGEVKRNHVEDFYAFPGSQDRSFIETPQLHKSHMMDPTRTREYFDQFYNSKRNSLGDSTEFLRGKIKEAHWTIQHQTETIARAENEISALQKQLNMLELGQEMNLQEIKTLKLERQNVDNMKCEGIKKREALVTRINQLDQDFKELSVSHNALLVECKKREGDFLQSDLRLNTLEAYNNNLQQVNTRMQKECAKARQQMDEIMSESKAMQMETQKAKGVTASALQEKQSIAVQNAALKSASYEISQQLLDQKSNKERLRQELEKLKMEYTVKCNRVSLLEEEVKQQQETFAVLQNELEHSFQREAKKASLDNTLMNLSLRHRFQDHQSMDGNSSLFAASSEIEKLKNQLVQSKEDYSYLLAQLESANTDNARLLNKNTKLKDNLDYSKNIKAQYEKDIQDLSSDNEALYAEVRQLKENEQQCLKGKHLQDELEKIKGKLTGLEAEKCTLMTDLQEFQQDKTAWEKEKGEMIMSLAELEAENNELRQQLKDHSGKVSAESVSEEVQTIKQELDSVHKMLRLKDDVLETQNNELQDKQHQLNKLTEEATGLKKGFAEISTKTTSRNLVISTLGDQLEKGKQRIVQLENELATKSHQFEELCSRHSKLETDLSRSSSEALQWITNDRKRLEDQRDILRNQVLDLQTRLGREEHAVDAHPVVHHGQSSHEELGTLRQENATLVSRLETLVNERDSVLQDSEDLMEGMQQLKEAFENEIERRLQKEREKFVTQQESTLKEYMMRAAENCELQDQHQVLLEENKNLELKCKNVEFERDELRRQVNELCESRARSEERTTQTDLTQQSPRRKEHRGRRRSNSVGVIVPIGAIDGEEESSSSPDCSPPRPHTKSST